MIESMYILFIFISFILLILGLLLKDIRFLPAQLFLLILSMGLFGALAAASQEVEVIHCGLSNMTTTTDGFNVTFIVNDRTCSVDKRFYDENMWIFGFFALATGVLALTVGLKFFGVNVSEFRGKE